MLVTNTHLAWWRSKREPSWSSRIVARNKPAVPTIHELINLQVKRGVTTREMHLQNDISLLKLVRRRNPSLRLYMITHWGPEAPNQDRNFNFARWIRHIERAAR